MKTVALRRIASVLNGGTPTADEVNWGGDVLWATPADMAHVDGRTLVLTDRTLTTAGATRGSKVAPIGSVLVSSRAPIGYTARLAQDTAFNQGCKAVVPGGGLDSRFLQYSLMALTPQLKAAGSGSTFVELAAESLAQQPIPEASLGRQRRIADFLDDRVARIDRIIAARQAQLDSVRERFAAERAATVLGTRSSQVQATDLPWAPRVGDGWRVRRLSHLARMGTGHTPSRSRSEYWVDCRIPWLTTSDVHRFRQDEIDVIDRTEWLISDIGLANSAAVLHPEGTVALSRTASAGFSIMMGQDMATSQDFVTWTCGPGLVPEFLLASLRVMRPYLLGYLAAGSTHKTIYFPDLMDLRVVAPDVTTQQEAAAHVRSHASRRDGALDAMSRQIDLLTEYKQSLITAAVTGELDVTTAGSGVPG